MGGRDPAGHFSRCEAAPGSDIFKGGELMGVTVCKGKSHQIPQVHEGVSDRLDRLD